MPDAHLQVTRRRFLGACGIVGATTGLGTPALGRAQSTTGSWPQPRFDGGQTGFNPSAAGPDPETVDRHWTFDGVSTAVTPIVSAERVFLPAGESILAIDRTTGDEDWRTAVGEGLTPVVASGNTLCAIDLDGGTVTAVDVGDGAVRWTETPSARPGTRPVVAGGQVYFADTAGVRVLDLIDGSEQWRVDLDGAVTTPMAVAEDAVFVGAGTALSRYATDGTHEWDRELLLAGPEPVVADGTVFAGVVESRPGDPSLVALETDDGTERWRMDRYADLGAVAAGDPRLFVPASIENAAGLFALDASDGTEDWRVLLDSDVAAPPTVGANHLYVSLEDGRVLALHREHGGQQWEWDVTGSGPRGQPVVAGDSVYVNSADAGLVALRGPPSSGEGSSGGNEMSEDSDSEEDQSADGEEGNGDGSDGFGDGFGLLASIAGVGVASSLYARRRDSRG